MATKKLKEYQVFNGEYFSLEKKSGYWQNTRTRERMHRYVWKYYYGEIPKGFEIHHIDGDKSNNDITNLCMLTHKAHMLVHTQTRTPERLKEMQDSCDKIRPLASAWHGSKEGKEWHKEHYEKMKNKLYVERDFTCLNCGKHFTSTKVGSKFCCNACKSKYRRKMGLDNVTRLCAFCGKSFIVNKYDKTKYCCKECQIKGVYGK